MNTGAAGRTDEELSNIAKLPELTEQGMQSIPGIGEKKVARYGKDMTDRYNHQLSTAQ